MRRGVVLRRRHEDRHGGERRRLGRGQQHRRFQEVGVAHSALEQLQKTVRALDHQVGLVDDRRRALGRRDADADRSLQLAGGDSSRSRRKASRSVVSSPP